MKDARKILLAVVVALVVGVVAALVIDRVNVRRAASHRAASRRAAVDARLQQRLNALDYDQTPLTDVFEDFTKLTGLELDVDWAALGRAGLVPESRINCRMRSIRAEKCLTILLDSAGAHGPIEFRAGDDGRVRISGPPGANEAVWEVYDVSQFLQRGPGDTDEIMAEYDRELEGIITETVDSRSWSGRFGGFGVCRVVGDKMVVLQTPENHQQLESLLDQLGSTMRRRELFHLLDRLEGRARK